ncbi:MAG: patatin-like phospholipase family protein [candidate division SR1 bacterium]|nr:patatin-like phospholipase family protein [candidate division SR1 bacterium]
MANLISKMFSRSTDKEYTLVISGGGARGAYALGILHAMEKLGIDKQIKAVYGVSAGAIVGAYRCAGYPAWEAFDKFVSLFSFGVSKINLLPKKSLIKNEFLKKAFTADLPDDFKKLKRTLYIGATNCNKAEYVLFSSGPLVAPLMGSMAIPGIFEPIPFQDMLLVDGGTINNFPVNSAKKKYPNNEIIGVALNKFTENQQVKNIFDNLMMGYELLLRGQLVGKFDLVDHLFYRRLDASILDTKEKDMRKIFKEGYDDCIEHFQK